MRALIQRVSSASVQVDDAVVGSLALSDGQQGLVVLVGATHTDTAEQSDAVADKVWKMRILDGEKSASDVGAPLLVISQFTLYANTAKGRRPSWNQAAPGAAAEPLVARVVDRLRAHGATVETGRFGAHMKVALVNDGPVTVSIEV
ncbi:D-aminoacyl-tRNA deacylase [Rhodococcoides kyotonense]|uniref:D-aminoacyl-tRNA deacylase n=1 Tax=Rhodococcoides kyotonense TaxID=398843 RepID=A0A239MPF2_9NOCA|nr:D-aminoacyl-tRNA deacylase [Rhodococcus kyotonensis]SNT44601.1 D-tyrosyl-tRNA(Tyr) deacylase [Rhodococcus kyotonensis]